MNKIHLFNPGYEAGVMLGDVTYTPPANVQRMRRELAFLPLWYAEPEDYVWVEGPVDKDFLSGLPADFPPLATQVNGELLAAKAKPYPALVVTSWGLSPQFIRFFEELAKTEEYTLYIPVWKEAYRSLINRRTAAICLDRIRRQLPDIPFPEIPCFCSSMQEIESFISRHSPPFIIKTPFSSSGRGLRWIDYEVLPESEKPWIQGALQKQKEVSIEKGLDKIQDFALEFGVDTRGEVVYKGLSLFDTVGRKTYAGNRLAKQETLEATLCEQIGTSTLEQIKKAVIHTLQEVYGGVYTGYVGVDMLLYTDEQGMVRVHPCVEINMRYTMGLVAIRLFERFIAPSATGHFQISYERDAYARHLALQKEYPLKWQNGKILNGYLPLCPVYPDTCYTARILID